MATDPQNRTYHDENGPYLLPNDSPEHERLDAQGASVTSLLNNKPFRAPLSSQPKKILDIGCGTGVTTLQLAHLYPSARVIGLDMSPIPTARLGTLPKNLEFIVGDIKDVIAAGSSPFEAGSFDYVFQRFLLLGMTNWKEYFPTLTTLLTPGRGWLECQDPSMTLRDQSGREYEKAWHYAEFLKDAEAVGLDVQIGARLEGYFKGTGVLEDVERLGFEISPVGREAFPEREALEGQLKGIFKLLYGRVFARVRSQEFIEKSSLGVDEMYEGLREGDHFCYSVVFGRRKGK